MAKICEDWHGNSLDLKLIIKDKNGNNILDSIYIFKILDYNYCEKTQSAQFKDTIGENAVSGVLKHLTDFFIFYAPTVNSYKRLKEERFQENWNKLGFMRDDCAVNIIDEKNVSKLLFSLTGADSNPYFSLYSLFTSIKSGVTSKFDLKDTLASLQKHTLPINLNEALGDFQTNTYLKSLFGEDIHQHYWAFYNLEFTEFMNQVDEWELNRYLYSI